MREIYKLINNFKIDKKFWDFDNLTGDDHVNFRSKSAPYLKLGILLGKKLDLKTVVEIGSSRYSVTQKCIDYFNLEPNPLVSPPCCSDGHSTFFWSKYGFDVHTVDIDENCKTSISWSYSNIGEQQPDNLNVHIPNDGISFLKNFDKKIDILFLDGWDKGTPQYAEKHLEAFLAAKDKLSDVHLIIIDDTDFITEDGGKDKLLTPHLIENGYIPLVNGRQTILINTTNVKTLESDFNFIENKEIILENLDITKIELKNKPKVILTLSTIPSRLNETRQDWGVKSVIERLTTLSYENYEIHFNIPYINVKTGEEYIIPEWLLEMERTVEKLKIFRCDDYGSITKIVPTLKRILDPNQIIIIVDDDINYMDYFIEYHLMKKEIYPDTALGFAGISSYDNTCHLCTTLNKDTSVRILEGYKTVSVERRFFTEDFFTDFVGKSWSDDIVISAHLGKNKIKRIVMNYINDRKFNPVVESFPIISAVPNEKGGCNLFRSENIDDNKNYFYKLGYFN